MTHKRGTTYAQYARYVQSALFAQHKLSHDESSNIKEVIGGLLLHLWCKYSVLQEVVIFLVFLGSAFFVQSAILFFRGHCGCSTAFVDNYLCHMNKTKVFKFQPSYIH